MPIRVATRGSFRRERPPLLPNQDAGRRQRVSARVAVTPWRGDRRLDRSERYSRTASQVSRMCGGVCGPRDRHRDLYANRHVLAGNACGIVRCVVGLRHCETSAEYIRAESQPAVSIRVGMTKATSDP